MYEHHSNMPELWSATATVDCLRLCVDGCGSVVVRIELQLFYGRGKRCLTLFSRSSVVVFGCPHAPTAT